MKHNYAFTSLLLSAALFCGCSNDLDNAEFENGIVDNQQNVLTAFAPDDNSKALPVDPIMKLRLLLTESGPDVAKGFGEITITQEEYEEIKAFTDKLVENCKTNKEKFETIFKWLYKTLEYKHEYEGGDFISNDPYPVFKTHVAICQGFSNLQHIMLESQNIPTINVNGEYVNVGGHAWNYVYIDDQWWVSDATNNFYCQMLVVVKYKHLRPFSADAILFETDDCTFNYKESELNIDSIKTTSEQFVVPFSAGGYKVASLNPTKAVPATLKEIFISKNIKTIGNYYKGLEKNAPSIEAAYVDPENKNFESYSGAVYSKNRNKTFSLAYLPGGLKKFELKPIPVLEKNTVFIHNNLEEVIIPNGTTELQDYAFEKCPNLRIAYIPETTKVSEKAFYNVHPDFKIIRADYTGIPEIRI